VFVDGVVVVFAGISRRAMLESILWIRDLLEVWKLSRY
jgi:hypothetical protein